MKTPTVIVADPFSIFRAAVRSVLAGAGFRMFEAASAEQLMSVLGRTEIDVALIDLDLPPTGALAAIRNVRAETPTHVVVWSYRPSDDAVAGAIRAGAIGYLDKRISPSGLVAAIQGVARGEAPLARDLTRLLIERLHRTQEDDLWSRRTDKLSAREREVLHLVAQGRQNKEIASSLYISHFTVKRHIQNILEKLELPTRQAAAALYRSTIEAGQEATP